VIDRLDRDETTRTCLLSLGLAFSLFVLGSCVLLAGMGLTAVAVRVSEQERCQSLVPIVRQCQPSSWNRCLCWWVWEEPPVMMLEDAGGDHDATDH
jgi:hypothetical protein